MENTVIKVLTKEYGAKVIKWWESQVESTYGYTGTICESEGYESIYYGVINGDFGNHSRKDVDRYNAKIIELPEDEFDMSTNEGRLAYAKKHYPVGTEIYNHNGSYRKIIGEPKIFANSSIDARAIDEDGEELNPYLYNELQGWVKIIKKGKTVETKVMEKQRLSRQGLKEIHSVACTGWKEILEKYGTTNPLEDYIELTQAQVDTMFNSCTKDQLPIVSKYLKQDDGSVDVSHCIGTSEAIHDMFGVRMYGEYNKKAFSLNTHKYDWQLGLDSEGVLCLIPTKKK
jgi:hypothetical protein